MAPERSPHHRSVSASLALTAAWAVSVVPDGPTGPRPAATGPDAMHALVIKDRPRRPRPQRGQRRWAVAGAAATVAVVLTIAVEASGSSGSSYRTASVERAD